MLVRMNGSGTVAPSARVRDDARPPIDASQFLRNIGLYAYVFYVVYTPTLSTSFFASKFFILSALALLFLAHTALGRRGIFTALAYRPLKRLLLIVFGLSLMVAVVRILNDSAVADFADLRIVQNNVLLLMAVHAVIILHICKNRGFTADGTLRMLYKLAAFQGVWGALSFIIPPLKEISNFLYEITAGEREFVTAARIYGLMGEYTFVTPIYHGMLAAVAIYFALNYRFRGIWYVPLILVAVLLNGRTGLAVFGAMVVLILLGQVLRGRKVMSSSLTAAALGAALWGAWSLLSQASPGTARFLQTFLDDTIALITDGSQQGNYAILLPQYTVFPTGMALIWGTGDDVYEGTSGFQTDVGFTNDIFMGGLIFAALGYGALTYFLLKNAKPDRILFLALLLGFLIGNLKGQIFIGTPVLFLFVVVVLLHKTLIFGGIQPRSIPAS